MAKHSGDKPSKSKAEDQEKTTLREPLHGIMPLLEEGPANPDSSTSKRGMHAASGLEQSADTVDTPETHAGKLDSLKDFLVDEDEQGPPSDAGARNIIDSRAIHPEVYASQGKPEMAAKIEMPETLPVEERTDAPGPRLRPVWAILFALIGITGFAVMMWMNFALSNRVDQLELQRSASQEKITSINQRMHELEVVISDLKVTVSNAAQPMPHQTPNIILPNQSLPSLDKAGHHG